MAERKTVRGITGQPVPEPRTAKQQHRLEQKRRDPKHLGTNVGGVQYSSGKKYYVPSVNPYTNPRTFREFIEIVEAHRFPLSADELASLENIRRMNSGIYPDSPKPKTKPKQKVTSVKRIANQENPTGGPTQVSRENRRKVIYREETETQQKPLTREQKKRIRMIQTLVRLQAAAKAGRETSDVAKEEYELSEMPYQIYGPDPHGSSDSEPRPLGKPYMNKKRAKTRADKLDQEIGGYRHFVRKVDEN